MVERKTVEAEGVCPNCNGRGHMDDGDPWSIDSYGHRPTLCPNCKSTGKVPVKIFVNK